MSLYPKHLQLHPGSMNRLLIGLVNRKRRLQVRALSMSYFPGFSPGDSRGKRKAGQAPPEGSRATEFGLVKNAFP